jgi:hypothetical protein
MSRQGPVIILEACGCMIDHGIPYRCETHQLRGTMTEDDAKVEWVKGSDHSYPCGCYWFYGDLVACQTHSPFKKANEEQLTQEKKNIYTLAQRQAQQLLEMKCEFCGDVTTAMWLRAKCHSTAPLMAKLENNVLTLSCYIPECGREVVKFKVSEVIK